jgi:hypothetical protein
MGQVGHQSCHFSLRLLLFGMFFPFRSPCMHLGVLSRGPGLHLCQVISRLLFSDNGSHRSSGCH